MKVRKSTIATFDQRVITIESGLEWDTVVFALRDYAKGPASVSFRETAKGMETRLREHMGRPGTK